MDGWAIWYSGDEIEIAWYKNDEMIENHITTNIDWEIDYENTGCYENYNKIAPIKEDQFYQMFQLKHVISCFTIVNGRAMNTCFEQQ